MTAEKLMMADPEKAVSSRENATTISVLFVRNHERRREISLIMREIH